MEQHEREHCYLQDMVLGTEQDQAKNDLDITVKFQSSRDDIKNEAGAGGGTGREPSRVRSGE